jgi:hypothetical protein
MYAIIDVVVITGWGTCIWFALEAMFREKK